MKNLILFALFLGIPTFVFSQSVEEEIQRVPETNYVQIIKARSLLINQIDSLKIDRIRDTYEYINTELFVDNQIPLYQTEQILLQLIAEDYQQLLSSLVEYDIQSDYVADRVASFPPNDRLFDVLLDYSVTHEDAIICSIQNMSSPQIDRDLLTVLFQFFLSSEDGNYTQHEINLICDDFLKQYPQSSYESFVRNNLRYVYKASKFGVGYAFFMGATIFEENVDVIGIKDMVNLGIECEFYYQRLMLRFGLTESFADKQGDKIVNGILLPDGLRMEMSMFDSSLGLAVIDRSRLRVTPYAGISFTDYGVARTKCEEEPIYEDVNVDTRLGVNVGINFDIRLGNPNKLPLNGKAGGNYIRLKYSYTEVDNKFGDPFEGNYHTVTVGISGLVRKISRDH